MPLIIITGLPSSGKTHRALQIFTDFKSRIDAATTTVSHIPRGLTVQHLTSSHASIDPPHPSAADANTEVLTQNPRDQIYNSAKEEKTARAEELSSAKRALNKSNIVVLDAPNYIKGFRYQLWCEAKAVGTRSVVVHVAAREDECTVWNDDRLKAWGWEALLEDENESTLVHSGAKVGKDVQGNLQPESHTAIYGDRLVEESMRSTVRSRTSSMGGDASDEDERSSGKKDLTETMTLKSLYISNPEPETVTNGYQLGLESSNIRKNTLPTPAVSVASSSPPSPTSSLPYAPATLQSLSMRYEPPSPFTRWDTPLFTVPSTDVHPPYQAIWDALFPPPLKPTQKLISQLRPGATADTRPEEVRRHAATVLPKATGAEALQNLESATADVVKTLLATARDNGMADGEGGSLSFSIPDLKSGNDIKIEVEVPLNTMLTQPSLQRLRRKYTQIQRGGIAHGQGYTSGKAEIIKDFSRFLQAEWNVE